MNREEYERLLKSDYWKGYSYSLIKERNFTCEDCGRQFPNERNKLQVHHLVYRDVNPWSYRPDEVMVLCEDCHKRRHGIKEEPKACFGEYSHPLSNSNREERSRSTINDRDWSSRNDNKSETRYQPSTRHKRFKLRYVLYFLLLFIVLTLGWDGYIRQKSIHEKNGTIGLDKEVESTNNSIIEKKSTSTMKSILKKKTKEASSDQLIDVNMPGTSDSRDNDNMVISELNNESSNELSTSEILDRISHNNAVKHAQREGLSTEGTTTEILDRISHNNAVKHAQREGLSTEGTTSEILDRISHNNAVKHAQREGLSTEGTTSEILDRISHNNAVKHAQREGLSTEGTTSEILDRISHNNAIKRAGQDIH